MFEKKSVKGLLILLFSVGILISCSSWLEGRIGGGQKYSSRGTSSSRSSGSYSSSSSSSSSYSSSGSYSSSSRYPLSESERNAIFMILGGIIVLGFLIFYVKTFVKAMKKVIEGRTINLITPLNSRLRDQLVARLQQHDPHFSLPLFMDFAQTLFTTLHTYSVHKKKKPIEYYAHPIAQNSLLNIHAPYSDINDIVIGSMSVLSIEPGPEKDYITIAYESNMTLKENILDEGITIYDYSIWNFMRRTGVISKDPGTFNVLACPNCGGNLEDSLEKKCSYCNYVFEFGGDSWVLEKINSQKRCKLSPKIVTEYPEEKGTLSPTVFQSDLSSKYSLFRSQNPNFNESRFFEKIKFIFNMLQKAWSKREWELARPFETDSLFQVHLFWINRYKKEGIRNILENILISKIEIVKINKDFYYDSITVRIHASMLDYTMSDGGRLLGGDTKKSRPFTEYWTFIRRAGVNKSIHDSELHNCPGCNYPLKVGMSGKCNHCSTKVTNGEFDWVLSMIEQDDSYSG